QLLLYEEPIADGQILRFEHALELGDALCRRGYVQHVAENGLRNLAKTADPQEVCVLVLQQAEQNAVNGGIRRGSDDDSGLLVARMLKHARKNKDKNDEQVRLAGAKHPMHE